MLIDHNDYMLIHNMPQHSGLVFRFSYRYNWVYARIFKASDYDHIPSRCVSDENETWLMRIEQLCKTDPASMEQDVLFRHGSLASVPGHYKIKNTIINHAQKTIELVPCDDEVEVG
jgi:hypothetical protein